MFCLYRIVIRIICCVLMIYEIGPRMSGLENQLNQLEGRCIHIVAFSEGAAAMATLLVQITSGTSNLTAGVISSIRTVTLLECPYGYARDNSVFIENWRNGRLDNLPAKVAACNTTSHIRLLNIREKSSPVQTSRPKGWTSGTNYYSIDTGSWMDKRLAYTLRWGKMHERPLHDEGSVGYLQRFIQN